jgi:hypothetical protein
LGLVFFGNFRKKWGRLGLGTPIFRGNMSLTPKISKDS